MKRIFLVIITSASLVSCGGGDSNPQPELSTGLKIFVSKEKHVGDFLNDPTLNGATAIEKADDFCNKSANKPNESIYKALLVDGINRDAITLTDWVLQASTTYYRPYGNIKIGTTTNTQILTAFWSDLDNTIAECDEMCGMNMDFYVWTGIDDAGDFSTTGNNTCNSWSDSNYPPTGKYGIYALKDGYSISSNINGACSLQAYLYCVEQP